MDNLRYFRVSLLLLALLGLSGRVGAQTYLVPSTGNTAITTCSGTIYDCGGTGNYATNNCTGYTVIYPATTGCKVRLAGSFTTEENYDYVYVYDGVGTGGAVLATCTGTGAISVTSTNGPITVQFTSDGSVSSYAGFSFAISCVNCTGGGGGSEIIVPPIGDNTITACSGVIYDCGGANGNYENSCDGYTVIYPSTAGACVRLTGSYSTENTYDKIYIYDGVGTGGTLLTGDYLTGTGTIDVTSFGGPITVRFTSDASVNSYYGFAFTITCTNCQDGGEYIVPAGGNTEITTCSGFLYDIGGPAGDYENSSDGFTVIYPATAGCMVHLEGNYSTESNYDYVYVYDGIGTGGALLATCTGTGTINVTSTSGPLTVRFTSDVSVNSYDGFVFSISCTNCEDEIIMGDVDEVTSCGAIIYDNGGSEGNYSAGANEWLTIYPTGGAVTIVFEIMDIATTDTLYIYNGTSAPGVTPLFIGGLATNWLNNSNTIQLGQQRISATIQNTSGALTLHFVSARNSRCGEGFKIIVSCEEPCQRITAHLDFDNTHPTPHLDPELNDGYYYIDLCPGATLHIEGYPTFPDNDFSYHQQLSSTYFSWSMDATQSGWGRNAADATFDPGQGYDVNLSMYDVHNGVTCYAQNPVSIRVRGAIDPFVYSTALPDVCPGTPVNLSVGYSNGATIGVEPVGSTQESSLAVVNTVFIPDGPNCETECYYSSVEFTSFPPGAVVGNADDILAVCINIEHSYIGDINISLVCPNGSEALLMPDHNTENTYAFFGEYYEPDGSYCDEADNPQGTGWNYCWSENSDYASLSGLCYSSANIGNDLSQTVDSSHVAERSQYYTPTTSFANLIGCPLNGLWSIRICDTWSSDNGYIFEWDLSLDPALMPHDWSYDVAVDHADWSGGSITPTSDSTAVVVENTPGAYTYTCTIVDEYGCEYTHDLTMNVRNSPHTEFDATACDRYTWNGQNYTQSGDYTQYFQTTGMCDSTVTLHLTINNSVETEFSVTECDEYIWNTETYTTSGDYVQEFTTVSGCDSTVTLHLTINNSMETEFSVTECDEYTWNTMTYTTSGDYVQEFTTVSGCDSIVTLHLTINNSVETEFSVTECDEYTWNTMTYTTSGDYVQEFTTVSGCDSTVTLHLTINNSMETEFSVTECDEYTWNTMTYTTSGDYVQHFQTVHGCDSTVTLHLTINNSVTMDFSVTECDEYTWNTETYSTSGDYVQEFNTIHGCDSTVTLHLTINNSVTTDFSVTECDEYIWNTETYTTSGDYVQHFQTVHGCDSTVTLHLTINNSVTMDFSVTECDEYTWNTMTYTTSGDYVQEFTTVSGCDSTVTLHLTINNSAETEFSVTECDEYTWNTTTYTTSGDYVQEFTTVSGCDSTVTLHLTINNSMETEFSVTECGSYVWNGQSYTASGDYVQHFQTALGCDSAVTLHLTINNSVEMEFTVATCVSYTWNGQTYTASGDYVQHFQTAAGCDSIVTLHLTISSIIHTDFGAEACESYIWNATTYTESGDYDRLFTSVDGCDSIATLHLIIHRDVQTEFAAEACETYTWNTETYTQGGDFVQHFQTVHGCDSAVTLHLTIHRDVQTEFTDAACETYTWNAQTYTQSGDYVQHFQTVNGCDSAVTLHLTIHRDVQTEFAADACNTYTWNTETYTQSGDFEQHFQTVHGCDSAVALHLTIHRDAQTEFTADACETYTWNTETYTQSGDYVQQFRSAFGCDSAVTLHLTIHRDVQTEFTDEACETYTWNAQTYTQNGDFEQHFQTAHGCDSAVTLHLTIHRDVQTEFTDAACETYTWNAQTYTQSGDYVQHFQTVNGCDSAVTLHLTIHRDVQTEFTDAACETYTWNAQTYTQSGDHVQHFQTVHGCDSAVTLHLTIHRDVQTEFTAAACDDYTWNTETYTETGNYVQQFRSAFGCDSTVTLHLTIEHVQRIDFEEIACNSFVWNGTTYSESGDYVQMLTSANGCDSIVTLHLLIDRLEVSMGSVLPEHCGQRDGSAEVVVRQHTGDCHFDWGFPGADGTAQHNLPAGDYRVTVSDSACTVSYSFRVDEVPGPAACFDVIPTGHVFLSGTTLRFADCSAGATSWHWDFGDGTTADGDRQSYIYPGDGDFTVFLEVSDDFGCTDTISYPITILEDVLLYVPSAFSPNANGLNEEFRPLGYGVSPDNYEMCIYNRWGQLVFRTTELNHGWDGTHKGRPVEDNSVMTYKITYCNKAGTKFLKKGTVLVLR